MTKLQYDLLTSQGTIRPLPGRCIILLDRPPQKIGLIHVPATAQIHGVKAFGYLGRVLEVTPKKSRPECEVTKWGEETGFKVGDRVTVGLHGDELDEEVIWARNGQIDLVIEE